MSQKSLAILAFVGGLFAGREIHVKEIEVPPNIIFFPIESEYKKINAEKIVMDTAKKMGVNVNPEVLKRVAFQISRTIELVERRNIYLKMLELASRALCEGRISRKTYAMLTKRYEDKLGKIELKLREVTNIVG